MRLPVGSGDDLSPGVPEQVPEGSFHDSAGSFTFSHDGTRVLVNQPVSDPDSGQRGLTMSPAGSPRSPEPPVAPTQFEGAGRQVSMPHSGLPNRVAIDPATA